MYSREAQTIVNTGRANGHDTHMSHTTTIAIVTLCIEKAGQANRDGVKREETSQGCDWKHTS